MSCPRGPGTRHWQAHAREARHARCDRPDRPSWGDAVRDRAYPPVGRHVRGECSRASELTLVASRRMVLTSTNGRATLCAEVDPMAHQGRAKVQPVGPLAPAELEQIDAYWRAANYLSVGQIYLLDNPLLREPLAPPHCNPRLLGHWGTTPGLNFIYAHMNRVIRSWDLDAIYVIGPGHGGPAIVANAYLEGTYTEVYPSITRDADGLRQLFRQFSFPGGIPSHVAPETPGSIHEGGELGY